MSGSVGGAGAAPYATDDATGNASKRFSTDLKPEHLRRAISVTRLQHEWSCSRDDVLAAVASEEKGFVYTYRFWGDPGGKGRSFMITHVAYQPDVAYDDPNYKPRAPR